MESSFKRMTKDSQPGRMGWRGISAPVTYYATDRKQDGYGAYIAIGEDPDDGELTLSLWTSVGGIGERLWAIWLPAGSKAALIAALTATAEPLLAEPNKAQDATGGTGDGDEG